MTNINQSELKTFLATVFNIDEKFVVPKKGNWYNPQSIYSVSEKPKTWLGYRIKSNKPISTNFNIQESEVVEEEIVYTKYRCSYMIVVIELQFIGYRSEEYANSVQFFMDRKDVSDNLVDCDGVIMLSDFSVYSLDYFQDGFNSTVSWNVNLKIEWTKKQLVNQEIAQGIEQIGGSINE